METKAFVDIECKTEPEGRFTARICAWNTPDKVGDVMRPGCFLASIERSLRKGRVVPVIYNHAWDDPEKHIGEIHPRDIRETSDGLTVSGSFYLHEATAQKVFRQLERRALADWSMGFTIQQARPLPKGGREIIAAHLLEAGPCLAGMGDTDTLAVTAETSVQAALLVRRRALVTAQLAERRARLEWTHRRLRLLAVVQ